MRNTSLLLILAAMVVGSGCKRTEPTTPTTTAASTQVGIQQPPNAPTVTTQTTTTAAIPTLPSIASLTSVTSYLGNRGSYTSLQDEHAAKELIGKVYEGDIIYAGMFSDSLNASPPYYLFGNQMFFKLNWGQSDEANKLKEGAKLRITGKLDNFHSSTPPKMYAYFTEVTWRELPPGPTTDAADLNATQPTTPPIKQIMIVVDSSGTETQVTGLEFRLFDTDLKRFDLDLNKAPWIVVRTKTFEFAIPPDALISIEVHGSDQVEDSDMALPGNGVLVQPHIDMKYLWMGKEQSVKGAMVEGHFRGKTASDEFKLFSNDLKTLKVNPALAPVENRKKPLPDIPLILRDQKTVRVGYSHLDTILILSDGTKVQVGNLQRRYTHDTGAFVMNGGVDEAGHIVMKSQPVLDYDFDNHFPFLNGHTPSTIEFTSLKSIQFGANDDVTITMKDGTKVTGTQTNDAKERITGFTGISENGVFFIKPKLVKTIQFDLKTAADSK